jgi:hypothetical protein
MAVALLAVPAIAVFWWFERHPGAPAADAVEPVRVRSGPGWHAMLLTRAAAVLGIGYATAGVFGLALARFGDVAADADLLGLRFDPVQSLVHLLLGVLLLHTIRTGATTAASTWLACALGSIPALVAASDGEPSGAATVVLHAGTAVFALIAAASCLVPDRRAAGATPG